MNYLIVVDMQNDFVTGSLGTKEAEAIVPAAARRIEKALEQGEEVLFTRDTHGEDYLTTQEGKKLPVPHCIRGTEGWEIVPQLAEYTAGRTPIDKPAFGSQYLGAILKARDEDLKKQGKPGVERVTLIGLLRAGAFSACAPTSASSPTPCSSRPFCRRRRWRWTPPAAPG